MGKQLRDVYCKYGAPMGRPDQVADPMTDVKVRLFRMTMTDAAYDDGGAYWGCNFQGEIGDMYIAEAPGVLAFVRAIDRDRAKLSLLEKYANLRFKR